MTVGPFRRNHRSSSFVNSLDPHVLICIIRRLMKHSLPLVLLTLGACQNMGTDYSAAPAAGTTTRSTAAQALNQLSSSATTASQIGSVVGQPALATAGAAVAQLADALATDLA